MAKFQIRLIFMGVMVAVAFAWVFTTQGPLSAVKVTVTRASTGDLPNAVFGVGSVEARRNYSIAPLTVSRIARVQVDQGDTVNAGQLLVELDPVDLDARATSSQQAAERAADNIRVAEAQLAEAQSRARTATASYARLDGLRAGGYVSQEMLDAKLHDKNAALSAEAAATAALHAAQLEHARVNSDAHAVSRLRAQTRLLSPVDGIVTARLAEPGTTVVAGQAILQVVAPDSLWVKTRIEQKQAGLVRKGQGADIVLRSQAQAAIPGIVQRVELVSDAITEERMVDVAFAAPSKAATIGDLAEVTIKLPLLKNVLSVPSAAVKLHDQQQGVWVVQAGRAQFRPVQAGIATLAGQTQILDGLAAGDEVIVYSQQPLSAGLKVKRVDAIVRGKP